jgi:hypothetical protein
MSTQQNYKSHSINPNNPNNPINSINQSKPIYTQPVTLLSTTYDPTKTPKNLIQPQNTTQNQQNRNNTTNTTNSTNTYLNQPIQYTKSLNTSTKTTNNLKPQHNTLSHPSQSGSPTLPAGLPTHPNHPMSKVTINNTNHNINNNNNSITSLNNTMMNNLLFIEKISDKLYTHFKLKYPATIEASGFNKSIINSIITQTIKKDPLNEKTINKIIDVIDMKFKMTVNSGNRQGEQHNLNEFTMDEKSKISIDTFLENYTNKVTILSDNGASSDKALEYNLPKQMSPINESIKIDKIEPFNEEFPIRDRDKQNDMIQPELREYIYYVVVNSNDRNITKFPKPNEFVIDFAPAPSGDSPQTGYIDRAFHNIKSCNLLSVVVLDSSTIDGSSDFGDVSFPYLLLQFDELQTNYFGTNSHLSKSFAILTDFTKKGKYKYYSIVGDLSDDTVYKIYNPRINLTKLTTRLLLPNGDPFNFGTAMNNDTSNSCITFGLSITTIQKNLSTQFINSA